MLDDRIARRRVLGYVVPLLVSLALVFASGNPILREFQRGIGFAFAPIEDALSSATRGVTSIFATIAEIDRLRKTNQALDEENRRLRVDNQQLEELRRENVLLSELLETRSNIDFTTVAAQVIARDASTFRRVITVDRGTDSGVGVGDVVIGSGAALAGRVIDVGPNYARILLISDTASTVIGLATPSGATGEVVGQLGGTLVMEKIASSERIGLDDQVVTAGIDLGNGIRSAFPKGLLIGRIVDAERRPNDVVQTAFLQPAADLDRLEYVLVIIDYEGGLPEPPPSLPPGELPGPGETPPPSPSPSEAIPPNEEPIVLPSPSLPAP